MAYSGYQGVFVDNPAGGIGPPGAPGPATALRNDIFTPILNQTVFNLSAVPISTTTAVVTVNGVRYQTAVDYTLVGTVLTWLNVLFNLGPPDVLQVLYQV